MASIYKDFNNPMNKMGDFVNQFTQFKSMFTGNPEEQVKKLIQSGQMSQEQFSQLAETANQLRSLIK